MLIEETMRSCNKLLSAARRDDYEEHWARNYMSLVLIRKLWAMVQCITDREWGGV